MRSATRSSARWLKSKHAAQSVQLVAAGETGPAAQHAAALEPRLISRLSVTDSLPSWRSLMKSSDAHGHIHNVVPGALRSYDLPDLEALTMPE